MISNKKKLVIVYCSLVLIKIVLATLINSPTIFGDEYLYAKAARSLFNEGVLTVHNLYLSSYPPLYSLILAPAYVFKDMGMVYMIMKVINALLSSLIIIPTYLLWREFFDEKKSVLGALLVGIMPLSIGIAPYLMAENLFHTLFLFAMYFVLKSITTEESYKHSIMAGICIALTFLTKFTGLIVLFFMGLVMVWFMIKKQFDQVKKAAVTIGVAIAIVGVWLVKSVGTKISNIKDMVDITIIKNTESMPFQEAALIFIVWIMIYLVYILLGTGIITNIFMGQKGSTKNNNKESALFWLSVTFIGVLTLILAKRAVGLNIKEVTPFADFTGRVIGRYIDFVLPLVVLLGFIGLKNKNNNFTMKRDVWVWSGIALAGFLVWYFPLFPFNNASITVFGALKVAIEFVIIRTIDVAHVSWITVVIMTGMVIGTLLATYKLRDKINFHNAFWYLTVFFILSSIGSIAATAYSANIWSKSEQLGLSEQLSKEIDKNKSILIDEKFCGTPLSREGYEYICTKNKQISYVGFWLNNNLIVGNKDEEKADYVITRDVLDKKLIRKTQNGIMVYEQE